jgi:predicted lipid-binding transport protein (Tim44 family)
MPVDILILAGIAIFVVLRLRGVLGQDVGHKPPAQNPYQKKTDIKKSDDDRVVTLDQHRPAAKDAAQSEPDAAAAKVPEALKDTIKKVHGIDKQFEVHGFLQGAASAFEMIVAAYGKHDRSVLRPLLSKELYEQFGSDIDDQRKRSERNESTLLAIVDVKLQSAELVKNTARLGVMIQSEQVHVVRNTHNDIVSGNSSNVDVVEDHWVFERDLRSANPNWTLITT